MIENRIDEEKKEKTEKAKTWLDYPPEEWSKLIRAFGDEIIKPIKEGLITHEEVKRKERRGLAYPVYGVITLIFLAVVYLASQRLIDGQSVTFLAGIMVGYLLSYLGGYIGVTAEE